MPPRRILAGDPKLGALLAVHPRHRVRDELRSKGRPIPENDVWIPALAVQHAQPVVSRDDHFDFVLSLPRSGGQLMGWVVRVFWGVWGASPPSSKVLRKRVARPPLTCIYAAF
jgi:hypothetical protein